MDIRTLQQKKVADLREIAKAMGFSDVNKYKKDSLIDLIVNGNQESQPEPGAGGRGAVWRQCPHFPCAQG